MSLSQYSTLVEDQIHIQLNNYDWYMDRPSRLDVSHGDSLPMNKFDQIPIIRVFGKLLSGHQVLCHIHGVFPYFFVPYNGEISDSSVVMNQKCAQLHKVLERRSLNGKNDSNNLKNVANVSIVKAIRFYGYHKDWELFYKISFLNVSVMTQVCELFREGKIFKKSVDTFESHIPYLLQFSCDYNLFGCHWMSLEKCYFRDPVLNDILDINNLMWDDKIGNFLNKFCSEDMVLSRTEFPRMGNGLLEIDVVAQHIRNRDELELVKDGGISSTRGVKREVARLRELYGLGKFVAPKEPFRSKNVSESGEEKTGENVLREVRSMFGKRLDQIRKPINAIGELWRKDLPFQESAGNSLPFTVTDTPTSVNEIGKTNLQGNQQKDHQDLVLSESPDKLLTNNKRLASLNISNGSFDNTSAFKYKKLKIGYNDILNEIEQIYHKPKYKYDAPFYSNPFDKKKSLYTYGGRKFNVGIKHPLYRRTVKYQSNSVRMKENARPRYIVKWKYIRRPPSFAQVWKDTITLAKEDMERKNKINKEYNRSLCEEKTTTSSLINNNPPTHFSMECFATSSIGKLSDPQKDEVKFVIWQLDADSYPLSLGTCHEGILVVGHSTLERQLKYFDLGGLRVAAYDSENDLFDALMDLVLLFDPDILSGYEIQNGSWGYVMERCRAIYKYELADELSRIKASSNKYFKREGEINVVGRYVFNIWRHMRHEIRLTSYTVENVAYEVLGQRIPRYSQDTLNEMWFDKSIRQVATLLKYWVVRLKINVKLLIHFQLIPRITEQARLVGIDFRSVYHRGSQYKVESFLTRITKNENFLLFSPSRSQVRAQKALECIPLVMEPESSYYQSPVLVLDFQSLYPSIICGYNYCYSTMLDENNRLDVRSKNVSPNGVEFVNTTIRESILGRMLQELLACRVMVKSTRNELRTHGGEAINAAAQLDGQQQALKLLANVTYGYAAASFSGRMPCSLVADSVVETGREVLRSAIALIGESENVKRWGARVVYGDTDSLFVHLPGKTHSDGFRIAKEIVDSINACNRAPIQIKLEKVYQPSLLLGKKRYVGYAQEHLNGPITFDAKGIETVRRDGCHLQQRIVEQCLRILFDSNDLSKVKEYLREEFDRIRNGLVSLPEFFFAREVRLGHYRSNKTAPAGAHVAMRQAKNDKRSRPQYRERVKYVVVKGAHGTTLRDRSLTPLEYLDGNYELDYEYYVGKCLIPPLERLFNCLGISVKGWDLEFRRIVGNTNNIFFESALCVHCRVRSRKKDVDGVGWSQFCDECSQDRQKLCVDLLTQKRNLETKHACVNWKCRGCNFAYTGDILDAGAAERCISAECPIFFERVSAEQLELLNKGLAELNEW
ncbi:hypothetical protein TBLA_0D01350 [Henningerozyma blattae CBS 6284]|uniref:DNA polymerase n=1 Tax=Henningerozyma blattae (strain ATCC 34711 / CBS 6284 / DSM 70876 / NBRC 10599 / NRRL Y-10934 / UCD 77-7) TaxID=1071380 RepID=I2H2P1_HENB6|nr:hypothetical protein TBLA_0D01350 [Tetrapisispora blattae CBS 6284]CCH60643.1 hypothetical protein TBLA_0D01350 [Tetrapisispora blattae CBS 6284]